MYIWQTGKLTGKLKDNQIGTVRKLVYALIMVVQFATGLLVFQAMPTMYNYVFTYAKEQLEERTGHPSLTIKVYQEAPEWFPWALGMILAFGLLMCVIAHYPSNLRSFIDRWICLNTPISLRILFVSLLFFSIPIVLAGLYFTNELQELQQTVAQTAVTYNPLKFLWNVFKKATGLKIILSGLKLLEGAQKIFKDINEFSFYAHLASYWIALVSTALYFWQLQKRLRCINTKP
ncbi:MAG: hypothetical protein AB7F19_04655 [Candidatus Babeliales bacterium]